MDNTNEQSTTLEDIQSQINDLNKSVKKSIGNPSRNVEEKSISLVTIPQGPGSLLNGDMVDGINANRKPMPNYLVPLGSNGLFPLSTIPGGASPGGTAGGDLSGTYPNPTVFKINTVALGTTTATAGNILIGSGTAWVTRALSGDATLGLTGTITLSNSGVTAATYGDSTHYPIIVVDAKGRITSASNQTINITPGGNNGDIQFNNSSSFAGDDNLFWDNTNKRLGIGTTSPGFPFTVVNPGSSSRVAYIKDNGTSNGNLLYVDNQGSGGGADCNIISSANGGNATFHLAFSGSAEWSLLNDHVNNSGEGSHSFVIENWHNGGSPDYPFRIRQSDGRVHIINNLAIDGTITSGLWNGTKIGLVFGGTNADLSGTGGTSQVLKQSSSGATITVGQLASTDLSDVSTLNTKSNTIAHYCGYFRTETGLTLPTTFLTTTNDAAITIKRITVDPVVPSVGAGTGTVFRFTDGSTNCNVTLGPGAANATATFTQNYASNSTLQMKVVSDDNATPPTDINMVVEYIIQ